ncbi:MAG: pyrroline-5-carboxylate reductase [Thermoanaerobaculales bacterium]|jgi:pyrroline-5-carboxylate reductase|nr:pyrroline-5-carboxylate reductase [Thermoanaerobaculales bacterium]
MALRDETLGFIGCGMIGEAMIKGLLREALVDPRQIIASHPRAERCLELENRYGVRVTDSNADAASDSTFVVIAVKPQFLGEVIADLDGVLPSEATLLSVVAGARMSRVGDTLAVPRVVRAMPNTPAQIGRGISVWTATDAVDEGGRAKVRTILSALGAEEFVTHESELDMATALSGTGPAYVFLFMEALVDAGVHMGFSRRVAERLVFETVAGSVDFAREAPKHLAELRNQVTSPGGTTAEAHYQLERGRLRTVLSDAVWAAYRRCQQLGGTAAGDLNGGPLG